MITRQVRGLLARPLPMTAILRGHWRRTPRRCPVARSSSLSFLLFSFLALDRFEYPPALFSFFFLDIIRISAPAVRRKGHQIKGGAFDLQFYLS